MNRWVSEYNTWMQGDLKLILNEDKTSVTAVISGSTIPSFSVYEEVIEEPTNMINPGNIIDPQIILLGDTPLELTSGTSPTGTGTITYQWEERT